MTYRANNRVAKVKTLFTTPYGEHVTKRVQRKIFSHFLAISVLQLGQYHNKDSEQRFSHKNDSDEENCVVRQVSYRRFPGFDRTHWKQIHSKKKR